MQTTKRNSLMIQEFKANVKKLFYEMVPVGGTTTSDAEALVAILRRRATRPIRVNNRPDVVQLTYYNVTIVIARDLSLMHIVYNSDFRHILRHIACADLHRLADFIVALERDIPQWKHIWMSHDLLIREKIRMEQKIRNVMHSLRRQLTKMRRTITEEEQEASRIHFYNLRAHQLMLEHDNPFWNNRKTEAEIIEQCLVYHITPPIEQWFEEWTAFNDECEAAVDERQRKQDVLEQKAQKLRHIATLKGIKAKALLDAAFPQSEGIEGERPFVSVDFWSAISVTKRQNLKVTFNGYYTISLHIGSTRVQFHLTYKELAPAIPLIIEGFRRIYDLVPPFRTALAADSATHGPLHLFTNYNQLCSFAFHRDDSTPVYFLSLSGNRRRSARGGACLSNNVVLPPASLTSCTLLAQINDVVRNIRLNISSLEQAI